MGKKKTRKQRNRLSRTASSDPTPKNKIETLTASHHRIVMITSSTETRRRMLLPHENHSKCGTENSTRLCSSYTEKKGWHKFCIQVQFYTVASNTYFAPACAKIRRKTWPKTVAIISRGGKKTQNRACRRIYTKITPNAKPKTRQDCALITQKKKGWLKCCNQVQFYTRIIDQFSISQCQISTKTWPKTVAVTLKNAKNLTVNTDRQNVRECDTRGWQNFCIQVQFYTRTIDQFCVKKCQIRTKTWPKTVAIAL
jgi:hypothetical protein